MFYLGVVCPALPLEFARMESAPPPPAGGAPPPDATRAEWRSLARLRDRVEAAARELERLRSENAALARRVLDLQDARDAAGPGVLLDAGETPEALRTRIEGYIKAIDRAIAAGTAVDATPSSPDAPTSAAS